MVTMRRFLHGPLAVWTVIAVAFATIGAVAAVAGSANTTPLQAPAPTSQLADVEAFRGALIDIPSLRSSPRDVDAWSQSLISIAARGVTASAAAQDRNMGAAWEIALSSARQMNSADPMDTLGYGGALTALGAAGDRLALAVSGAAVVAPPELPTQSALPPAVIAPSMPVLVSPTLPAD